MSWTIKIEGVEQTTGALYDALYLGSVAALEKLALRGTALVQLKSPVAFGILANSITQEFSFTRPVMSATIFAGPPADVYAAPVEEGTAPHFPPPSALVPWVVKKFGSKSEKEALSIAFAIAKNIAKRGTKGAHMFQNADAQLEGEAQGIYEHELAVAARAAGFGEGQAL